MEYNNKIVRVGVFNEDRNTWTIELMRQVDIRPVFGVTYKVKPYRWWEFQRFITIPYFLIRENKKSRRQYIIKPDPTPASKLISNLVKFIVSILTSLIIAFLVYKLRWN